MSRPKHRFQRFLLEKVFHFQVDYNVPPGAEKCVMVFAPHTRMWDFVIGRLVLICLELKPNIMVKKELFFFPLGPVLRHYGAIPVDRASAVRLPKIMAQTIRQSERLTLMIAPEGTRKLVTNWKRGFYYIAQAAQVPIFLSYIDWKTRRAGIGPLMQCTGDYEKDFEQIVAFYKGMQGKYKGLFNLE